jgi:hypothetical protein
MEITLPLFNPSFDDRRIIDEVNNDFDIKCEINIYKDEENWMSDDNEHVFSLWVKYGENCQNALMFDVGLDHLEMFANSLLKSIEMLRRDYSTFINDKIKKGAIL